MEERVITISRARSAIEFPANFMLVAAMNPCPCGYYNHPQVDCQCQPGTVQKYINKISGPLFDRIDIHVEVIPVPYRELADARPSERSEKVRERVILARQVQEKRFEGIRGVHCNAQMSARLLRKVCQLDDTCQTILKTAMERLGLSARAFDRILKVSRTIADLDSSLTIHPEHLSEAINYRSLDRDNWGR